jgi:hypothetical protein
MYTGNQQVYSFHGWRRRWRHKRFVSQEDVAFLAMPDLVGRLSKHRLSGAMYGLMGRLPFYRHLIRHLLYEF